MEPELSVPLDVEDVPPLATVDVPRVAIRELRLADQAFVYGTWLQGHYEKSLWAKGMEWEAYKNYHHAVVERLLYQGAARTLVACAPEEPDQIFGYCTYNWSNTVWPPVLHYLFVKGPLRRFGIANKLMEEAGFSKTKSFAFTQLNNSDLIHQMRKKWPLGKYVPYLLFP